MPGLNSATVHKHWRYTLDHDFQAVLPGGELVSDSDLPDSGGDSVAEDPKGNAAKWAPGSPHDSSSSILDRFVPFPKPVEQWNGWSLNSDNTLLAVSTSRGYEENAGILLVNLSPDDSGNTILSTATQAAKPQSVFGRLGSYVFGTSSKGHQEKPKTRTLTGFIGRLSSLVFSPTNPDLLIIGTEPSYRGPTAGAKETLIFWDVSSNQGNAERMPEEVLENSASQAIDVMAKELAKHRPGSAKSLDLTPEDKVMVQKSILGDLHQIDLISSTNDFDKVFGRLSTSFDLQPVSADGKKVLYMPGPAPDSNGKDDRWEVAIYDIPSKKTIATMKGHEDAIMWTEFSPSGRWIMTVAWDKTVRLWTSEGKAKWVWKTKGQNWTGAFSPDETYVVATCGDGTIFAWSIETGEELWRYRRTENHRWIRSVAFSPDGKYLAFGGEEGGRVSLIDLQAPLSDTKRREVVTYRELGAEGVKRPTDDDDDDEDLPEDRRQTPEQKEKMWKNMVKGMISTRDLAFLKMGRPNGEAVRTSYHLVHSNSVDRGLEIYDLGKNQKWRVQVVTDKQSPQTGGETDSIEFDGVTEDQSEEKSARGKLTFPGVYDGLLGWKYLHHSEQVMTIHSDGVRFWRYD